MTANLHISPDAKKRMDEVIPKEINGESVSYDDFIRSVFWFLEIELGYGQHDIINMIASYKANKLLKREIIVT